MAKAYGVLNDEGKRSVRAVFVLDKGGTVLYRNMRYSPFEFTTLSGDLRGAGRNLGPA